MGRAICQEGIPTQSRTVGACSYSPSFDPTPRKLELCRACSQTLPAECWLRIVEVQVKAKPLNAAPGQPHSRAFLGQPPRSDLGRRAGLGRRQAGPGFPACPFNPAVRREHVSGAPGGTRAPPPRRQLYFEHCLWPAARRLGSAVCLASLLLILFLQRSPLPFIRPRLEVGTPPISPPPPQAHTHSTRSNSGVETQKTSSLGSARLVQDAGVISPSPSNSPVPLPPAPATREGTVPPTAPSPACAQCPTGSPQNLPILPSLSDCPRPASEVLPVTATSDPKLRGEPPNFSSSFPSSLSSSSHYLHLHRHLHLRHPPTAAAATSSASFSPPPPPLFSLFGSRWTSGVDGGSGGSLSSSSPRRTPALAHPASFSSPTSQSPERCRADSGRQRRSGCSGGRSGGGSGSGGGRQDERTR
ncbi:TPA: hypothetical protein BOS_5537 [Bos taurus]|nr:TPA: hypothetical protein BOS_5537 [Bos taurus]